MPGFLKSTPVTDQERRAHDRHSARVVVAVLVVLVAYAYLFTFASDYLGLPDPAGLADAVGLSLDGVFDEYGNVESRVIFAMANRLDTAADELLVFYLSLVGAFLSFYFLPLRYKQPALVGFATLALVLITGPREIAGLLFAHVVAYLVFHPTKRWPLLLLPGMLAAIAFVHPQSGVGEQLAWLAIATPAFAAVYRWGLWPLLQIPRAASLLRVAAAHSALIVIILFALIEWLTGYEYELVTGILLFFWQWSRMIMYQIDYKDGLVPADTSLVRYLAVFISPGGVPAWGWGVELGLGYAYCNNSFLSEDKNRIVMNGVKMLWLALGYLVLGDLFRNLLADGAEALGVAVHGARIVQMVDHFMEGGQVSTASVLLTSLLDTLRWTIWFVGVVHFKTGIWRICGYQFEPYFNRPWLATNLVVFWSRYTYYYREFLLQAFYYPVFFRFFRKNPRLRIVVSIMAAAGAGNMIWGHMTERMYDYGMSSRQLSYVLHTWPYYVLLGGGIALTALYLLDHSKKKKRRAWTPGPRIALDVLAAYATLQYFSIIHIMSRPSSGSDEWDLFRLFLRGFGVFL